MNQYEVIEEVEQVVVRRRRWIVSAISEQDAILHIRSGEGADGYRGESREVRSRTASKWIVDGKAVEYRPEEAVPMDDGVADIGGPG